MQNVGLADLLRAIQRIDGFGALLADLDDVIGQLDLPLSEQDLEVGDANVGQHAQALRFKFLFESHSFVAGDGAIQR